MDQLETNLFESIWDDADFKTSKMPIKQTGEANKKDSIRRLNDDKMVVTNCKVCNCEMDISTHYSGEFPLCQRHRNPNDRPFTQNKGYKKHTNNWKK